MSHLEDTLAWQIKIAGLPEPERQYRFDPERRWRIDLAWPILRLGVEVEGEGHVRKWDGKWIPGRHLRTAGLKNDIEKYNQLAIRGWCLLRFTAAHIKSGEALSWIETAMEILGKGNFTGGEAA